MELEECHVSSQQKKVKKVRLKIASFEKVGGKIQGGDMKDWSKADWVDPAYQWKPLPVPAYPERMLVDYATKCNLRCPMCMVWGWEDEQKYSDLRGAMDLEAARKMLDEVMQAKPMVAPSLYGEPLLIPNLEEVFLDIKKRGMPIVINTNGLTLTERQAKFFVEIKVESVMFSIDAVTSGTLKKVRTTEKLARIESAVFRMMKARGEQEYPRIGVSYTVQENNKDEVDAFVARWVGGVDVVRIGLFYDKEDGTFPAMHVPMERKPCQVIYKTLPVHNDGSVRLCCLDGLRATDMGNVFQDGVQAVWNGERFSKVRYYHETGQWEKVPFCKDCNGWTQYEYEEEIRDNLLIRRSPQFIYYNKIDRLQSWKGSLLGGHKPPLLEAVSSPLTV